MSETEWAIPVTTKTVHTIDYYDLERLVNETYGFTDWSFVANEECGNDSDHELNSSDKYVYDGEREELAEWAEGDDVYGLQYRTDLIVFGLAEKGLIPKGDILVRVSW
jgi:hypothetical protein